MAPRPSNALGALYGLLAMGLFACADISVRFLGAGYNPFQIIFFSGLLSFPILMGYVMLGPADQGLRPHNPRLMALRCTVVVLNSVFGTYAFANLPLAQCYAIFFLMPIFITVLSWPLLGERIDLRRGIAVLAGLIGVLVALDPGHEGLRWAHAAAFMGALVGAGNYIIIRKTGNSERTAVMVIYPLMLQTLVAAAVLPLVYVPMPLAHFGIAALMALVTFAGYLLIIAAYRRAPGIVVAPMQYSQIIWAAIMGHLLFGEAMSGRMILGTCLIIAAGIAIVARQEQAG